ncbi:MAG: S-layer homology domain-containing protein [Clostridia bacterium]|nr:S-layer homology domain-containing protein [Clostridia bacterium]
MSKKILSIILSAVMLCGTFLIGSPALAAEEMPFTDVKASDWFYESVKYAYNNSLMEGTGGTSFSPMMKLSRAQFVTILGRMAGAEKKEVSTFPDVEANSWYSGYVGWAVEAGIVKGLDNGKFGVNDPVTREMAAVMVSRFVNDYKKCNITTRGGMYNFNDADKVSSWAADSIAVLRNSGVVEGDQYRNFNPQGNMTRSEAAAIFMRLDRAIKNAWQGYLPDPSEDSIVYGASYLYWNGTAAVGGMGQELDKTGSIPVMKTRLSRYDATYTYHHPNTTGVSINYLELDVTKTPYVKVAYKNGMDVPTPEARYIANKTRTEQRNPTVDEVLTLTAGADDSGFKTATIDLTVINEKYPTINYSSHIANLLFYPCTADYEGEGTFDIAYIAFFKTKAEAEKFTVAAADADVKEYIESYEPYSDLNWNEFTADDEAYYDKTLADRIREIKTSESLITPEQITAAGGKVYYISSINGSDENDGLTPETPYKTTDPLFYMLGPFEKTYLKAGDGVFFERGSVFYGKQFSENSLAALETAEGVSYGAYGTGPKPLFTMAIDFTDSNGVGVWHKTEWKNIYVLDKIADDAHWWGHRSEVGNIFFNGGEGLGVRIIVDGNEEVQYLGEGQKSTDRGYCCNGYEYFYSPVRDLTNPGTALQNDLEFFHDYKEGKLYLYSKNGNPADRFDDIKVSRCGAAAWASGGGARYDNLAFMYSTDYAVRAGDKDITFTNCEIGCVGGSLSSVESGVEIYGDTDGAYFYDNYIHDVGDGGLTSQGGALIQNIEYVNNVMVACGHSAEIWSGFTVNDDGTINERINNVLIKGNMMAYNGYGMRTKQDRGSYAKGETICGSMYGEYSNCIAEGNLYYKGQGSLYTAYVATYDQPRGWMAKGNTYVCNSSFMRIGYIYETLNHIDHRMWKRARVDFPFNYETLVWYTGLGVDPKGVYYHYDEVSDAEDKDCFFMTGYYVENGGFNK